MTWRMTGAPALPPHQRKDAPPDNADRDREREIEQRVQASYQSGYSAGLNAGAQQATERMQPVLASLAGMIQELAGYKKKFRHEAEASTVGLALSVARRVLYREVNADPEAILGLVKAAFDKLNVRETHRLRISPPDLAFIQENSARLGLPPALEIASDGQLPRGSAVFETSRGELDASIDSQLLEIERGFADIIRRRT